MSLAAAYASATAARLLAFALGGGFVLAIPMAVEPDAYGRFAMTLSVVQVFSAALLSWPNIAFVRQAREQLRVVGRFSDAFGGRIALLVASFPLALGIAYAVSTHLSLVDQSWMALAVLLFAVGNAEMAMAAGQVVERFAALGLGMVLVRLGQLAGLLAAANQMLDPVQALLAGTVTGYLASAGLALGQVGRARLVVQCPSLPTLVRMVGHGWSLIPASFAAAAMPWVGVWIAGRISGVEAAGHFAWVVNVSLLATALFSPLSAMLLPRLLDRESAGGDMAAFWRKVVLVLAAAGCICGVLVPATAVVLAQTGLGAYTDGLAPLLILMAVMPFQLGIALFEPALMGRPDKVRRGGAILIAMALTNGLAAAVLLPWLGLVGLALALGLGFMVAVLGFAGAVSWACLMQVARVSAALGGLVIVVAFGAVWQSWPLLIGGSILMLIPLTLLVRHHALEADVKWPGFAKGRNA